MLLLFAAPLTLAQAGATILVLGDSLSANYGIDQKSGWVKLLQQRLIKEGSNYQVVNASISGETTSGALNRIDATLAKHHPAMVIIELGGNDGLRGLSLEKMRANLSTIIDKSRDHNAQVLLLGMRLPPNYGAAYTNAFENIYHQLAQQHGIPLVPFLLEGLGEDTALFQSDGIHPMAEAQPIILENIWRRLAPMLAKN